MTNYKDYFDKNKKVDITKGLCKFILEKWTDS